ncbi:chorismate-binding protein, partial [Bacillus wiedmannii]|nr:chorismate-binding protein [Bacillus wiedmannii]
KDLHEHAVVVEAVAAALRPYCHTLHVPEKPSVIHSEAMWHLSTEVKGELKDPNTTSLELAIALHPTPAVCGTPMEEAREAIQKIEPFDREFFTGMLGWSDLNGDGEWIVTIRCAEVQENTLRLYAGAGVVAESKPEDELAETSAKFQTMLKALGLRDNSLNEK